GLLVGVLHEFVGKWVGSSTSLAALPTAVPFLLLFVVLLFTPKGKLPDFGQVVRAQVSRSWLRGRQARLGGVLLAALALTVPFFAGAKTILFTTALVYVGLLLSIGLLMRLSGMVSLCQVGFMGIGAAIFGRLEGGAGLPWPIALLLAALLTVPFGAVVAIPAIRLSGLYLTLATFGYGILVEQILYRQPWLFANSAGVHANRPPAFQSDSGYYYFVLGIAVVLSALVAALERARLGRLLRALGDSPRALAMHGTNINVLRLIVFCVASFLAAVSGALYVPLFGSVNGDSFPSFTSLVLLALLAICGRNVVLAAIVAGLAYVVAPGYLNSSTLVNALPMIFGVSAIVAALGGIRGRWKETPSWPLRRDWSGRVPSRSPAPVPLASRHAAPAYLTARSSLPTPSYSQRTARP
ncbi:MAG TPA: branched-chain amino acid ABC transporter permease, partial [Jatrophihabitans sp.]